MSLRGFGKGFFSAAGPSFVRGMEKQQGRIETRRQEERQDVETKRKEGRQDLLLKETRGREDKKEAYNRAQTDGQGAANESVEAVNSWYDALSPELQKQFVGIKNQYTTQAARKKRNRELTREKDEAAIAAGKAQTEAAKQKTETSKFTLEQGEATASGRKQWETLSISDEDGYAATIVGFRELTENGYTPANIAQARRIAKVLDAYSGSNEFYDRVEQGKRRDDQVNIVKGVMDNLRDYSPDMIWGLASRMEPGPEKDRLMSVANGMGKDIIEAGVERVFTASYEHSISMGVGAGEAEKTAAEAANDYRKGVTKQARDRRLTDIAKAAAKSLSGVRDVDIRKIMKVVRTAIQEDPDLFPGGQKVAQLKQMIIERLGLDPMAFAAGSGPAGPLGGMQGPAEQALPDTSTEGASGAGGLPRPVFGDPEMSVGGLIDKTPAERRGAIAEKAGAGIGKAWDTALELSPIVQALK